MKRLLQFFCVVILSQALVSCYPQGPDSIDDYDVAITNYDKTIDFANVNTLTLADSVVVISDGKSSPIEDIDQDAIMALVKENFENLGYTFVDTTAGPKAVITISAVSVQNFVYYQNNWYEYWGWWWNGYLPGFGGPYYPWYPWGVYSYQSGSIIIDMVSTELRSDNTLHVIWSGIADGILSGRTSSNEARFADGINQCFIQSPYLKIN